MWITALETDSIEVIEEQMITKIFKVRLGNQTIQLDDSQATELYLQLKKKFETEKTSITDIDKMIRKAGKMGFVEYEGVMVPVNYKVMSIQKSQPRNGKPIHHYHYFKDNKGNYGFLIKNGMTTPFAKLGSIKDPSSGVGKIVRALPLDGEFRKKYFVNNHINVNNQRVKAIIDILILEGYVKKVSSESETFESYRATNKVNELESITALNW